MDQSITKCAFNSNGQIFAYAVSYDWSKVCKKKYLIRTTKNLLILQI